MHDGDDRRGVHRVLDSLSGELALTFVVFAHYTLLWFGSPVVTALDSRLDIGEFDSRPPRLISLLIWVTVFGRANHLSISPRDPGQLSLLPSAGREMTPSPSAVMLCGWGVKAGWLVPYVDKRVGGW